MNHHSDLSEDEFINIYNSDPFFRERINVEIEKLSDKRVITGLKPLSKCLNEQELNDNISILKHKNSETT